MLDSALPPSVRQRIGDEGSLDFTVWMEARGEDWKADVVESCTNRFGRMLAEELAKLRVELGGQIVGQGATLRQEMAALETRLRQDMAGLGTSLHQEMAATRVDVLRWAFLFWLGQIAAIAALLSWTR